jgi:hypothetical protein
MHARARSTYAAGSAAGASSQSFRIWSPACNTIENRGPDARDLMLMPFGCFAKLWALFPHPSDGWHLNQERLTHDDLAQGHLDGSRDGG